MPSTRFRLLAAIGVATISFTAILVRQADTAPVTASLFLAIYALPFRRDRRPLRSRAVAIGSGLLLSIDLAFWHAAIDLIGAGLATVLANTQVIFVAMLAWFSHKERPTKTAFRLIPIIFIGVVLLSGLGRDDAYGDNPWAGVGAGLMAGVFYALFILTLRASNRDYLAPTSGPMLDSTIGIGIGALIVGALPGIDLPLDLSAETHWWLLLMALVGQVIGWPLINTALPRLAALDTSAMILAQPMLTVIWALLIFSEDLSVVQWLGVATVLGGLLVLNTRGAVERPPTSAGSRDTAAPT
jgi:drug/metabolite transporter (DMT)-like permease